VEERGRYYEEFGGPARTLVQNHLTQMLASPRWKRQGRFDPEAIRNGKRAKVLQAAPLGQQHGAWKFAAMRGQFTRRRQPQRPVQGLYRDELGVNPTAHRNLCWRMKLLHRQWLLAKALPFYLRTGKRLPKRLSEGGAHLPGSFPSTSSMPRRPANGQQLILRIQPDEGGWFVLI